MLGNQPDGLDALLHRRRPSWLQKFSSSPFKTLAKTLYSLRVIKSQHPESPALTIICISDTHNYQPSLPPGDLLIHAGDTTQGGTFAEFQAQLDWLNKQPHEHKVLVAGNHELLLDPAKRKDGGEILAAINWGSVIYLQDSATTLKFRGGRSIKVYGSPWTRGVDNWAFRFSPGSSHFTNTIPDDIDVLVTHCPPRYHCDIDGFGDESLLNEITRISPRLHVFGHVHEGHGRDQLIYDEFENMYRSVCRGNGGVLVLLQMLFGLILSRCWLSPSPKSSTILLNASMIGGLRDEERRSPLKACI